MTSSDLPRGEFAQNPSAMKPLRYLADAFSNAEQLVRCDLVVAQSLAVTWPQTQAP